jgi:lipoprotein-anchoring transpeptidase ErfK/SrfK
VVKVLRRGSRPRRSSPERPPDPEQKAPRTPLRQRPQKLALIVAILCVAALVGGGTAAFANDALRRPHFFPGTRIGGVYVGGQPLDVAEQNLRRVFVDPLHKPMSLVAPDTTSTTTPWDLGLRIDVGEVIATTFARQQAMPLPQRLWRWVRGDRSSNVPLGPLVDKAALKRMLSGLAQRVDRPVRDASIDIDSGRLRIVPEQFGRQLDVDAAAKRVAAALTDGDGSVQLPVHTTQPQHRAADFEQVIVIREYSDVLDLYQNGELVHSYGVATGLSAYPTPHGHFFIVGKQMNPSWINPHRSWSMDMPEYIPPGPDNPLGTRAMQLDADAIYIHGTPNDSSIGSHASHGCIRMHMGDAEDLFQRVAVGTPVLIVGA